MRKVLLYFLSIFQTALYTPVVLSFVLFVVVIPMFFFGNPVNPLFRFIPDGSYGIKDVITVYGKFAFGLSLIMAIAEATLGRRFHIGVRKKIIWLGSVLLFGYFLVFVFFIFRVGWGIGATTLALLPFLILSMIGAVLSAFLSGLMYTVGISETSLPIIR